MDSDFSPDSTSNRLTWVLGTESAEEGTVQDARLIIAASPNNSQITLRLIPFPSAHVWFDSATKQGFTNPLTWQGSIRSDTAFLVHFKAPEAINVKLLASLSVLQSSAKIAYTASPAVTVRTKEWLSPGLVTAAGPLIGFFLGFLTHVLQKRYDDWQEKSKQEDEIFRSFVKGFNAELVKHRFNLTGYMDDNRLDLPSFLPEVGYNALLKEAIYIDRFLQSMKTDIAQIKKYYTHVHSFNETIRSAKDGNKLPHRPTLLPLAEALLAQLNALQSTKP